MNPISFHSLVCAGSLDITLLSSGTQNHDPVLLPGSDLRAKICSGQAWGTLGEARFPIKGMDGFSPPAVSASLLWYCRPFVMEAAA